MTYYPVGIPTLCRYEHFKRCVESLANNTHADKTELVIGLDFPPSEKYREGYEKIKRYVNNIKGFAKVTVIRHKKNLGAAANWRFVSEYIFENYEAAIMSEDDNEFSPCFLDYMDKYLDFYKEAPSVLYICGYSSFIYKKVQGVYAANAMSAWGCGTWRQKYKEIKEYNTINNMKSILSNTSLSLKLFKKRPNSLNSIMNQVQHKQVYGDACTLCNCLLNDKFSLFPNISLVKNWGNDGSGEHCKNDSRFALQQLYDNPFFDFVYTEISEEKEVRSLLRKDYNKTLLLKIVIIVRYLIYRYTKIDILKSIC